MARVFPWQTTIYQKQTTLLANSYSPLRTHRAYPSNAGSSSGTSIPPLRLLRLLRWSRFSSGASSSCMRISSFMVVLRRMGFNEGMTWVRGGKKSVWISIWRCGRMWPKEGYLSVFIVKVSEENLIYYFWRYFLLDASGDCNRTYLWLFERESLLFRPRTRFIGYISRTHGIKGARIRVL